MNNTILTHTHLKSRFVMLPASSAHPIASFAFWRM